MFIFILMFIFLAITFTLWLKEEKTGIQKFITSVFSSLTVLCAIIIFMMLSGGTF